MENDIDSGPLDSLEVACPFCGSTDTEFMSLFGSQLLTRQLYCNSCRTPFEQVKSGRVIPRAESLENE